MTSAENIDIQLSGDDMTIDEFINQGKKRVYVLNWTDRTVRDGGIRPLRKPYKVQRLLWLPCGSVPP